MPKEHNSLHYVLKQVSLQAKYKYIYFTAALVHFPSHKKWSKMRERALLFHALRKDVIILRCKCRQVCEMMV